MKRRDALLGLLALAAPVISTGQSRAAKRPRIGFLGVATESTYASRIGALRSGLRALGYVERESIAIEYRWAGGRYEALPALAAELVRSGVDVIVTHSTPGTRAAKQATATIPIVIAGAADPVASGLVTSLAHPGGNVTGSAFFGPEINSKRLELLKEAVPNAKRIAILRNPDNRTTEPSFQAMKESAKALQVEVLRVEARRPDELKGAFSSMARERADALALIEDPMLIANSRLIADLAAKQHLPSTSVVEYTQVGGLMEYGADVPDLWRRAASFVDKILKGAKPGDLPIERASTFVLAINLKTARTLGISIPQSLMLRADRVIE